MVELAPQTASLYAAIGLPVNLHGLSFSHVASVIETDGGVPVLVVAGTIASVSPRSVKVPRLHFSIRDRSTQEVYRWTTLLAQTVLEPGKTLTFRSRLASPPPQTHEVVVRFLHVGDVIADLPSPAANWSITNSPLPPLDPHNGICGERERRLFECGRNQHERRAQVLTKHPCDNLPAADLPAGRPCHADVKWHGARDDEKSLAVT